MQGFMESTDEMKEKEILQSKLFACMLAKHQLSRTQSNKILYDFKEMYTQSSKSETVQSNVYYMKLVDENHRHYVVCVRATVAKFSFKTPR